MLSSEAPIGRGASTSRFEFFHIEDMVLLCFYRVSSRGGDYIRRYAICVKTAKWICLKVLPAYNIVCWIVPSRSYCFSLFWEIYTGIKKDWFL